MCALECWFSYNLSSHNHYHPINKIINFACQKNQQKSHWNANHHHCDTQENICENGNDLIIFLSVPLLSFFCCYSLSLWHVDFDHHHSFMCVSVDKYHTLSGWDNILTIFCFEMIIKLLVWFAHLSRSNFAPATVLLSQFLVYFLL